MSDHTPGPWTFSRDDQLGDARFYVAQADNAPYTPNYSDVATLIAETCSGELVTIQEANARLISSAPELLAALILMVRTHDEPAETLLQEAKEQRWLAQARAAIAKATQ